MLELSLSRTFAPGSESSTYGTFVPRSEDTMELSLPGAKGWWNFRSQKRKSRGTFALKNFRSRERKFHVWNFRSRERRYHGTSAPRSEKVVELSLPRAKKSWNFRSQSETD